jgi:hypothetical protein
LEELQERENARAQKAKAEPKRMAITAEAALKDCGAVLNYIANTLLKPETLTLLRPAQQNNEVGVAGGDDDEIDPDVYSSWIADSGMGGETLGDGGKDSERVEAGPDGEDPDEPASWDWSTLSPHTLEVRRENNGGSRSTDG